MKFLVAVISFAVVLALANAKDESGRYNPGKYGQSSGRYMPMNDRSYYHVHDMRELGRYVHVHIPYDGGYGPYTHPYTIPYKDFLELYNSPNFNPFDTNIYDIPVPDTLLQYGFPDHQPNVPVEQYTTLPPPPTSVPDLNGELTTTEFPANLLPAAELPLARRKRAVFHYVQSPKIVVARKIEKIVKK